MLSVLVDYVDERSEHWRGVLERVSVAEHGETFTHAGHSYTRIITRGDARLIADGDAPGVHVRSPRFGRTIDVNLHEDTAFWMWAIIETLRHSGLFATDLVNNGLPIHIGAALLGHLDLDTTRG